MQQVRNARHSSIHTITDPVHGQSAGQWTRVSDDKDKRWLQLLMYSDDECAALSISLWR